MPDTVKTVEQVKEASESVKSAKETAEKAGEIAQERAGLEGTLAGGEDFLNKVLEGARIFERIVDKLNNSRTQETQEPQRNARPQNKQSDYVQPPENTAELPGEPNDGGHEMEAEQEAQEQDEVQAQDPSEYIDAVKEELREKVPDEYMQKTVEELLEEHDDLNAAMRSMVDRYILEYAVAYAGPLVQNAEDRG